MNTTFADIRRDLKVAEDLVATKSYSTAAYYLAAANVMSDDLLAKISVLANSNPHRSDADRIEALEREVDSLRAQVGPYRPAQPDGWQCRGRST